MTEDPVAKRTRVSANVVKMQAQGASDDEIEHYVRDVEGLAPVAGSAASPPTLPRFAAESTMARPTIGAPSGQPGIGTKILGTAAALDRDIPGAEAAQAAIAAGASHIPFLRPDGGPINYAEARHEIRQAEDAAPWLARNGARLVGGTVAAMALPGNAVAQGARYGALEGLGQSDSNANSRDRLVSAVKGAALGGAAGKAGDVLGTLMRAKVLPVGFGGIKTVGRNELDRTAAIEAADRTGYGAATREAAATGGTSPDIQAALAHPTIAPFVKSVRELEQFKNASDADVLQESYRQMSEYQRRLGRVIENAPDFRPTPAAETQHVALGKARMLDASDATMPSFRPAVQAHAAGEGELDAMHTGAEAAQRTMSGSRVAPRYFDARTPEAFSDHLGTLSGGEATAAQQGVLGALKAEKTASLNPLTGFGGFRAIRNASRVSPFVSALDQQTGNDTGAILRAIGISGFTPSP